ncbi:MAG: 4-coumarate--CoA ligase [Pseudomonadota bacterium]
MIDAPAARRLCIALIADHQKTLIREGRLGPDTLITRHLGAGDQPLAIEEDTLGFDSLSLLDLILVVNRYFALSESGIEDYLFVQRDLDQWADLLVKHFEIIGDAASITFSTSGSTGAAKTIRHPRAVLEGEADVIHDLLAPAPGARVLSLVPPQHIYGFLWSVLFPNRSGMPVIALDTGAPSALSRHATAGDIVLGTPYLWEKAAAFGVELPAGITGICSGGPTTAATWDAIRKTGVSTILEVYGSTETGGIATRSAPSEPFQLMPHLKQRVTDIIRAATGETLPLQDNLAWCDVRMFNVEGRKDTVVQVAGTNVNIDEVSRTILASHLVKDCAVRLGDDRLKAFVVPKDTTAPNVETELREALSTLPAVARPDQITFGPELPRTPTGKPAAW